MANPLYGQNKADDILDALASASDNIVDAEDGDTNSAGEADSVAAKVLPITVNGVTYYLPLYSANTE